jgi:2-dehydro-3-deoxygluconokinase
VSQLRPGQIDWDGIFGRDGSRWFHTGGIFAALSETAPLVAMEAMEAARRHGTIVSYDLNYRPSLWKAIGGQAKAREVNRSIAPLVDVLLGNEEAFTAALGFEVEGLAPSLDALDPAAFGRMIEGVVTAYPNVRAVATTLRVATTATRNDWGAVCWADGTLHEATRRPDLEILDRVGGGDSFASGLIHGLLAGLGPERAVEYGAAHGALAMTTPGDTSMATLAEVEALMAGGGARVQR